MYKGMMIFFNSMLLLVLLSNIPQVIDCYNSGGSDTYLCEIVTAWFILPFVALFVLIFILDSIVLSIKDRNFIEIIPFSPPLFFVVFYSILIPPSKISTTLSFNLALVVLYMILGYLFRIHVTRYRKNKTAPQPPTIQSKTEG